MARDKAYRHLQTIGLSDRVIFFETSTATVALAAEALGCEPARIAKSMALYGADGPVLVIAAGDVKLANAKFRAVFGVKASMIRAEEVESLVGHAPGGVCPFGVKDSVAVWLDESLKRFDIVYPACGDDASAVRLTPEELFAASGARGWVDVAKEPPPAA